MEENTLHNHDTPVLDWLLDHFALLVMALAAVAVGSVVLGSGMVMFGAFDWAEASEVAIYTALILGGIMIVHRIFHCIREACHRDKWHHES